MASDGHNFERASIPLIRFLAPGAFGTPSLGDFDRIGVDQLSWSVNGGIELVVQCKGFKAAERELGKSQIDQCKKSIQSFAGSGQHASRYLLIHNREGKSEMFRSQITEALDGLVASGQVNTAQLWSCDKLMVELAKEIRQAVLDYIGKVHLTNDRQVSDAELVQVPIRESECIFDRNRLKKIGQSEAVLTDPAEELLSIGSGYDARAILLGEAGYGKTTVALRAARSSRVRVFYLRAAALTAHPANRSTLLDQYSFVNELLEETPAEDLPTIEPLMRSAMESVFSIPNMRALLVIDGIDESLALSQRGGLHWLFNTIKSYEIPVILTSRTEFWLARSVDFAASLGAVSPNPGHKQRDTQLKVVELLPWNNSQILWLAEHFQERLLTSAERDHIQDFIQLVKDNNYNSLYGDIPKRPLFLRLILETVAQSGVQRVGRIKLFHQWARQKIIRDYSEPIKFGSGRQSIFQTGEVVDVTIDLAFRAMMRAAALMSKISKGVLEMLPTCMVSKVLEAEPTLNAIVDPLGLFLNSLLVPVERTESPAEMRFGHQVYQEFFLAKFIDHHPEEFANIQIPSDVKQWREIEN